MEAFHKALEGKIDFEGQRQVEQIVRISLIAITGISFVAGFAVQSLQVTFGTFGASTLLLALVVIPQWPVYNKHPMEWLPPSGQTTEKLQ